MQRRLIGIISCAFAYGSSAIGCGQVEVDGGGSGGLGGAGSGSPGSGSAGSGSASGVAGAPAGGEYSGTCTADVVDSGCDEDDDCPVTTDLMVRCDVEGFGLQGGRAAPRVDGPGVYLTMAGYEHAWFATLSEGNADFEELPSGFRSRAIPLTLSPDGVPALAVNQRRYEGDDLVGDHGTVVYEPLDDAPTELSVLVPGADVRTFEYDAAGSLQLAHRSEADIFGTLARAPGSAFATVPGLSWLDEDEPMLTADGQWVALRLMGGGGENHLSAITSAGELRLLDPFDPAQMRVFPVSPALPATGELPVDAFVAGAFSNGVLFVLESRSGEVDEFSLDLSLLPPSTCLAEFDGYTPGTCPESCEDVRSGILLDSLALAQTPDGRIWVTWLHSYVDELHRYQEYCWTDDSVGCSCNPEVTRDDTRAEIVLVEVDIELAASREVLRLPSHNTVADPFGNDHLVDLRAFGSELALSAQVQGAGVDGSLFAVRVLEIDTARIAPLD